MFTLLDLNPPKVIDAGVIHTGLGNHPVLENLVAWYNGNFSRDMQSASFQYSVYAFGVANRKEKVFCRLTAKLRVPGVKTFELSLLLRISARFSAIFKN